jgi:Uma2 family endonuclease
MTLVHATPKFWTREAYNRLIELGALGIEDRVELIEGAIIEMPPPGPEHTYAISSLTTRLVRLYGDTHRIRVQLPLDLGNSQPQPDFSLVRIEDDHDPSRLPGRADLVMEVSRSSLHFDRHEKASIYAKAGIPEFWILNLVNHQVEVHRRPGPSPEGPYDFGYASRELLRGAERVSPLFSPQTSFAVADLV